MSFGSPSPDASGLKNDLLKDVKTVPVKVALLLSFAYLASSLSLPFLLAGTGNASYMASWAICILCIPVLYISAKKISHAVWLTVLWFFLSAFIGSPVIPSFFFGTVIATASASVLLCSADSKGVIFLAAASTISYVLSAAVTGDYTVSLFSLSFIIPALILALATKKKTGMTSAIALCGLGLALSAIAVLIYRMQLLYGDIGSAGLGLAADSFVDAFVYYTEYALKELNGTLITPAIHQEVLSIAESYVNLAPSILAAICLVLVYLAHSVQRNLFYAYGIDEFLVPQMTALTVSVPAAVVFLISYLLSFATSSSGTVSIIAAIGNNLCLMLTPCLILKGFAALKALPMKLGFWGILIAGGLIFFILMSPSFLSLLALVGAFFVLIVSIDRWAKDFYGKGERK